jgi:hypothetical protein
VVGVSENLRRAEERGKTNKGEKIRLAVTDTRSGGEEITCDTKHKRSIMDLTKTKSLNKPWEGTCSRKK